jgi:leucyl aminopeptidase
MATLSLASKIQIPLRVVGVLACAENMPSGTAYRPSDVYRGYNGVSVEIINTDAEGRLCLADALSWACHKFNPRSTIDLATLTGAIGVALGTTRAGLFCKDKLLSSAIIAAARESGERVWPMPMDSEYDQAISAGIADIKNQAAAGTGVSTSAMFLTHFVTGPHAHLDIASVAWSTSLRSPFSTTGATGWGVKLLHQYLVASSQPASSSSSSMADPSPDTM